MSNQQIYDIQVLIDAREVKKAEVAIARALRTAVLDDTRARLLTYRARVRLMTSRPEDSIDDLETARGLDAALFKRPDVLELLADCHLSRFELSTVGFASRSDVRYAREIYEGILSDYEQYDNRGWVYYQSGRISLILDQVQEAETFFRKALFQPSQIPALTAYCYERLGFIAFYEHRRPSEALTFLNKAVHTYPAQDPKIWLVQVHILRSKVLREIRSDYAWEAAERALKIAESISSGDDRSLKAEALFTISEMLAEQEGKEAELISYLQQFLQITKTPLGVDVTWSRAYEMLGDAYFKLAQYEQAVNAYRSSLGYNPYHPWEETLYYRIARCYYNQRAYHLAIDAITKMMETAESEGQSVTDYRIYSILGNAHYALGNYPEAVTAYQTALDVAPPGANVEKVRTYHQIAQQQINQPL